MSESLRFVPLLLGVPEELAGVGAVGSVEELKVGVSLIVAGESAAVVPKYYLSETG